MVNHETVNKGALPHFFTFKEPLCLLGGPRGSFALRFITVQSVACVVAPEAQRQESMIRDLSGSLTRFVFSISRCEHAHMLDNVKKKNHNTFQLLCHGNFMNAQLWTWSPDCHSCLQWLRTGLSLQFSIFFLFILTLNLALRIQQRSDNLLSNCRLVYWCPNPRTIKASWIPK